MSQGQEEKGPTFAVPKRFVQAMKVAQAAARKEKEASEAQRALAAVARPSPIPSLANPPYR